MTGFSGFSNVRTDIHTRKKRKHVYVARNTFRQNSLKKFIHEDIMYTCRNNLMIKSEVKKRHDMENR